VARTNLHVLASRLLDSLDRAAAGDTFEGKLRQVSTEAGLNSVRSAEAVKLLETLGRIEVVQRGRRGRDTVISILSTAPVSLEDAQASGPPRSARKSARIDYEDLGRAVVDRLLELGRDDSLRAAQVEAFASESTHQRQEIERLEGELEESQHRERDLRIRLKSAEEALSRAEENLSRAFGFNRPAGEPVRVDDDDAQAVLEILKSGRL
jgi:chromosome segregation ATPase